MARFNFTLDEAQALKDEYSNVSRSFAARAKRR